MSDSTNIMDLPTDPAVGGNNISLTASDKTTLDQTTINQLVSGLQQANGATQLPSRDIPMNTANITTDAHVQPNYMPPVEDNVDYIKNYEVFDDAKPVNTLDDTYNEIQTPILLAVLYFLFQLPIFKRYLFTYFPILFSKDGNMNINGFVFNSALFGLLYYLLDKVTKQFDRF